MDAKKLFLRANATATTCSPLPWYWFVPFLNVQK
jgi:hypothetical protein